jgi:hypothetical protein
MLPRGGASNTVAHPAISDVWSLASVISAFLWRFPGFGEGRMSAVRHTGWPLVVRATWDDAADDSRVVVALGVSQAGVSMRISLLKRDLLAVARELDERETA